MLSVDEFAMWTENAIWLHKQMQLMQMNNAAAMFGGMGETANK